MISRHHKHRKNGFTIAEMLVALAIIGLTSALMAPKILSTQNENSRQAVVLKVDALKYQVNANIKMFQNEYSLSNDDLTTQMQTAGSTVTLAAIYGMYGNYFAYKVGDGGNYYFLMDRSKLSFVRNYFLSTPYSGTSGVPTHADCTQGGANYCLYLDVNGPGKPNKFITSGKVTGQDIIPLYVDPISFEVSTLYEATADCATYSVYDALVHPVNSIGTELCDTVH